MPLKEQAFKRLSKKAKKGLRGWPVATIAFYGPDASRATKVVVSIIPAEQLDPREMREANLPRRRAQEPGNCGVNVGIHGAARREVGRNVRWANGCPHQTGIDYEGEWCPDPACKFWHGRNRFTHKLVQ